MNAISQAISLQCSLVQVFGPRLALLLLERKHPGTGSWGAREGIPTLLLWQDRYRMMQATTFGLGTWVGKCECIVTHFRQSAEVTDILWLYTKTIQIWHPVGKQGYVFRNSQENCSYSTTILISWNSIACKDTFLFLLHHNDSQMWGFQQMLVCIEIDTPKVIKSLFRQLVTSCPISFCCRVSKDSIIDAVQAACKPKSLVASGPVLASDEFLIQPCYDRLWPS